MSTKHTPLLPWRVVVGNAFIYIEDDNGDIAQIDLIDRIPAVTDDDLIARARLIAEVPGLLNALVEAEETFDVLQNIGCGSNIESCADLAHEALTIVRTAIAKATKP